MDEDDEEMLQVTTETKEEKEDRLRRASLLFLIADYLERCTPCKGAATKLKQEVEANELLGNITGWDGRSRAVRVEDYQGRFREVRADQLEMLLRNTKLLGRAGDVLQPKEALSKAKQLIAKKEQLRTLNTELVSLRMLPSNASTQIVRRRTELEQRKRRTICQVRRLRQGLVNMPRDRRLRFENLFDCVERGMFLGITQDNSRIVRTSSRVAIQSIDILKKVVGHNQSVFCVKVDKTGRWIVTGSDDSLIKLWNASTGMLCTTFRGHADCICDLAIDPSNTLLASSSLDKSVRLWELLTGRPLVVLGSHKKNVNMLCFDPVTAYLVSSADDGTCCVWDTKRIVGEINQNRPSTLPNVSSPSQPREDIQGDSTEDGDRETKEDQFLLSASELAQAGFSNEFIATASGVQREEQVDKRDARTPIVLPHCDQNAKPMEVSCAVIHPKGGFLATGSDDGIGRIWSIHEEIPAKCRNVPSAMTAPDLVQGNYVDGCARLVCQLRGHSRSITMMSWSNRGDRVITGSVGDGTVRIWYWTNTIPGQDCFEPDMFSAPHHRVLNLHGSVTSHGLASGSQGLANVLAAASSSSPSPSSQLPTHHINTRGRSKVPNIDACCWNCDDSFVVTMQSIKAKTGSMAPGGEHLNPDLFYDQAVKVWNSRSGQLLRILRAHRRPGYVLAPHPSQPHIVLSIAQDGLFCFWDIHHGELLKKIMAGSQLGPPFLLDAAFVPGRGDLDVVATDSLGRIMFLGTGNGYSYLGSPPEQFLGNDYAQLIRDTYGNVMDSETGLPTHLVPRAPLCDYQMNPYPIQPPEPAIGEGSYMLHQNPPWSSSARESNLKARRTMVRALEKAVKTKETSHMLSIQHLFRQMDLKIEEAKANDNLVRSTGSGASPQRTTRPSQASHVQRGRASSRIMTQAERELRRVPMLAVEWDEMMLQREQQEQKREEKAEEDDDDDDDENRPTNARRLRSRGNTPSSSSARQQVNRRRGNRGRGATERRGAAQRAEAQIRIYQELTEQSGATNSATRRRPSRNSSNSDDDEQYNQDDSDGGESKEDSDMSLEEEDGLDLDDDESPPQRRRSRRRRQIRQRVEETRHNTRRSRRITNYAELLESDADQSREELDDGDNGNLSGSSYESLGKVARRRKAVKIGYDRSWLEKRSPPKVHDAYVPQKGDLVVYCVQGHELYLRWHPIQDAPPWQKLNWQIPQWSFVLCRVDSLSYEFPDPRSTQEPINENSPILAVTTLSILAVPGRDKSTLWRYLPARESNSKQFSIAFRPHHNSEFVILKECFEHGMRTKFQVGQRIRALYSDETGSQRIYKGRVLEIEQADPKWPGSPWESLSTIWLPVSGQTSNPAEMGRLSPWEAQVDDDSIAPWAVPLVENDECYLGLAKKIAENIKQVIARGSPHRNLASDFIKPVDLYEFEDYGDVVPLPMDLRTIVARLENGYYRHVDAVQHDIELIHNNCFAYNPPESDFCKKMSQLLPILTDCVRSAQTSEADSPEEGGNRQPALASLGPGAAVATGSSSSSSSFGQHSRKINIADMCLDIARTALELLAEQDSSRIFAEPVSEAVYLDYYEIVAREKAMDFSTLRSRLIDNKGKDYTAGITTQETVSRATALQVFTRVYKDFDQVFVNACMYNPPDTSVHRFARSMKKICDNVFKSLADSKYFPDHDWKPAPMPEIDPRSYEIPRHQQQHDLRRSTRTSVKRKSKAPLGRENNGKRPRTRPRRYMQESSSSDDDDDDDDDDNDDDDEQNHPANGDYHGSARVHAHRRQAATMSRAQRLANRTRQRNAQTVDGAKTRHDKINVSPPRRRKTRSSTATVSSPIAATRTRSARRATARASVKYKEYDSSDIEMGLSENGNEGDEPWDAGLSEEKAMPRRSSRRRGS